LAIWVLLILSVFRPFPVLAADPWSKQDIALEGIYLALKTIDMGQTLDIAAQPDKYYEVNPVLGRHPSKSAVYAYFLTTSLLHIGITNVLPTKYRPWFQGVTIGLSGACVIHNYSIGLRVNF
jgi:hypothetical protein